MPERNEGADLTPLEEALRALAPRAAALDRDALMFRAGQAAARRGWGWLLATAASAAAALVLAVVLVTRPEPAPRVVVLKVPLREAAPAPAPVPPAPPYPPGESAIAAREPGATPYLRLQDQVSRWGLDGLPDLPPEPPREPLTAAGLLRGL
jgi:hypothetical protein